MLTFFIVIYFIFFFQVARRIVVALTQKITYDEYLPKVIGERIYRGEFLFNNKMEEEEKN